MKRLELKRHNADHQRSYSLERAYLQGWNDADGSHWREPSEMPDVVGVYLIIVHGEKCATLVDFDGAFFVAENTIYTTDEIDYWMKVPNVSKS